MQKVTVLFVVSSIVILGGGAIFYIKNDVWRFSDDTVFPYVSGQAPSDVYKRSNIRARSDIVDQDDVYKNNITNHKMICKSSTSYDQLSVAPRYTQPIRMDTKWVCDLYHEVKQMQSKQVTLLICSNSYLEVLVNWLAQAVLHAHYPVDNILIIASDSFTHHVMRCKGIHSVFISVDVVFNPLKVNNIANRIWTTKLTVIRLLNHWNYNVLSFDTDALMLKNVQPLLDKFSTSDIVASSGTFPVSCSKKWNAPTMCMGAIFYKSSPATEQFWMSVRAVSRLDDQLSTNTALDNMGVQWKQINGDINYYTGITSGNTSLTVTTLPQTLICRRACNQQLLTQYYVWHKLTKKVGMIKRESMIKNHIWLLNDNWYDSINTTTTPKQWLLSITKHNKY